MKEYISIGSKNVENAPVLITNEQIDEILDELTPPVDIDKFNRESILIERRDWLYRALSGRMICSNAFPMLKYKIVEAYKNSLVLPGNTIMECGQNIQSQNTQSNISSFHQAGYINNESGRVQTKDIIKADTSEENKGINVHLKDKTLQLDKVRTYGERLIGTTIKDCVRDYKISKIGENMLKDYEFSHLYLPETNLQYKHINSLSALKSINIHKQDILNEWTNYENIDSLEDIMICRLYLKIDIMFRRRITITKIAELLESEDLLVFHNDIQLGFIDLIAAPSVFLSELIIDNRLDEFLTFYYEAFIISTLQEFHVSGIKGITGSNVMFISYNDLFDFKKENDIFVISQNEFNKKHYNVPVKVLETSLRYIKKIKDETLELSKKTVSYSNGKLYLKWEKEDNFLANSFIEIPITHNEYSKYFEYNYLSLQGSGYRYILGMKEVDSTITTTNDIKDIAQCLGIEAARKYLYNAYKTNVPGINPANITPYADIQTINGLPSAISENGSSRQIAGPFSSIRDPGSKFKMFSADNKEEQLNIPSSIATGSRLKIGVNYSDVVYKNPDGNTTLVEKNKKVNAFIGDDIPYYQKKKLIKTIQKPNKIMSDIIDNDGSVIRFNTRSPKEVVLIEDDFLESDDNIRIYPQSIELYNFENSYISKFCNYVLDLKDESSRIFV